jgi:hypothetical protein
LLLAACVSACGGPTFDGQVYRGEDLSFRLGPLPSNWRRIDSDGALLAFRNDSSASTIAVNGRCGVDGDDVPLASLTQHLFLHFTDRKIIKQETVKLDGREALRTDLIAELDGVDKHYVVYVLKKDGCVYDFLLIEEAETSANNPRDFETLVTGFATNG